MKTMANNANGASGGIERDQLKSAKIAVLKLINEHKETLFGKLSETLTREGKEGKWAEVAEHAHELGAFPWHRSWDYLKDTTWQNWRKRFVEKREKKDKFEKMGLTTKIIYDEADLLIMEILDSVGRNNAHGSSSSVTAASLNNSSYSMSSVSDAQIRDISDVLEIEFDVVKNEGEALDDDDDDVTDGGVPGNQNQMEMNGVVNGLSNDIPGLGEYQQGYDINGTGFQNHNGHGPSQTDYVNGNLYEEDYDETSDLAASGETQIDTANQPKIMSTSSLASPMSRASLLRKTAYASLRSGVNGRKRPASCVASSNSNGPGMASRTLERELMDLKCRKIRAELELLDRESYKKDLEILQLERSLGLPSSHITRKFYKNAGTIPRGIMNNNHSNINR